MKLNEKILYYRKAAKLSQEELAAQVGVSRQAVSKWELADAVPELDKLLALARVFGVTTDELLREDEPSSSRERAEEPPASPEKLGPVLGRAGRLIRKYGWLAGVYVSLYGLGITVVGALARWGFRSMLYEDVSYSGPPWAKEAVMEQLRGGAASPFGGAGSFALGFANVILLIGGAVMLAGIVLAVVLYRMGNKKG